MASGCSIFRGGAEGGYSLDRQYFEHGFMAFGGKYYYIKDHLGTVWGLYGQGGAQHGRWRFTLYGERGNNEVTGLPMNSDMGFTGHYQHVPSGLVLAPYRAYDPETARWLSKDPLGEFADGPNLYSYVLNNPVNLWDPYGLWSVYRFIYTGDGNASDDVYNAAVDAAADYLYCNGGVRGITAGARFNFPGKNTLRGQVSAGVGATLDDGWGAQAGAGINVKTGKGTNLTFGGGYAWNQRQGGGWRGGGSLSSEGVRGSQGFSDGQFGGAVLGLNFGPFANAGLVIDPQRVLQNFKDSFDILFGRSTDASCP